jgi:membrane protein implicated in regulation of membrane protease activity
MAEWMISNWMVWVIAAAALVILEILTGTFYLLMIAIGLGAGAVAAWQGADITMQFIIAAIVGAVATYALRQTKLGTPHKVEASRDPNVNLDIGQAINVHEWQVNDGGKHIARVKYRGAMWDVELEHGAKSKPGAFIIHEIRGSHLIVNNAP